MDQPPSDDDTPVDLSALKQKNTHWARELAKKTAEICERYGVEMEPTTSVPPVGTGRPVANGMPVEKNPRFAEAHTAPEGALPLHSSVFRPFDPKDHPSRVNDFDTLEKRLPRLGLTCTFPASSFNRPMGNPEWSLKSILQSRYIWGTDPREVEYEAEFVWADGKPASTRWLLFEDLNWPWGIRIMRIFHQKNIFKPMDKRMQDQNVLNTEGRVERSEWFNGKDIYREEYILKAIYFRTKYEQVELYEQTAAVNQGLNRGWSTTKSPPPPYYSPSRRGGGGTSRPRGWSPARSPRRGDAPDTEMTEVESASEANYSSEGNDPEMLATYRKAQEDFMTGGDLGLRHLPNEPMDMDAMRSQSSKKSAELIAAEGASKTARFEKLNRASEQIQKNQQHSNSPVKSPRNNGEDEAEDNWQPPHTLDGVRPPQIKVPDNWMSPTLPPRSESWIPPIVLPGAENPEPPATPPPPPKLAPLSKRLADIKVTPTVRYEKLLSKKKSTKFSGKVGGKERYLGMNLEGEEEGVSSGAMVDFDTDFDADVEYAGEALDPSASKRSRGSAGSDRGDLKRSRFFDQGGMMEDVEEGRQSEEEQGYEPEETKGDESDKMEDEKEGECQKGDGGGLGGKELPDLEILHRGGSRGLKRCRGTFIQIFLSSRARGHSIHQLEPFLFFL
ncbi:uncharacterized protein DFL_004353 [Arthrobotrys flagrans]|uniref:Uncharacterized protein n=1 Tax=Arthrobotrys flagrans TaxID=97331 RepID=A0A437A4M3_ARTFL|nr:hypothetical protein DFL_004353 [Arthrobotrys flagrans]